MNRKHSSYILLVLLSSIAGLIQGMDSLYVDAFDFKAHKDPAISIFSQGFPQTAIPVLLKTAKPQNNDLEATVLMQDGVEGIFGLAIYKKIACLPANSIFEKWQHSPIDGLNEQCKVLNIKYIAVEEKERGKGYGSFLIQDCEDLAQDEQYDFIMLEPTDAAQKFYLGRNFTKVADSSDGVLPCMVKPITAKARNIVESLQRYEREVELS